MTDSLYLSRMSADRKADGSMQYVDMLRNTEALQSGITHLLQEELKNITVKIRYITKTTYLLKCTDKGTLPQMELH